MWPAYHILIHNPITIADRCNGCDKTYIPMGYENVRGNKFFDVCFLAYRGYPYIIGAALKETRPWQFVSPQFLKLYDPT